MNYSVEKAAASGKMTIVGVIILLWIHVMTAVSSESFDICYLIDLSQKKEATAHDTEEKFRLVRSISRCLLSKRVTINVATILYDDEFAKLGFNFRNVSEVLSDRSIEKMMARNEQGLDSKNKIGNFSNARHTIRSNIGSTDLEIDALDSPQTMAFLTAAKLVLAAGNKLDSDRESVFKVLVISSSDFYPVVKDAKESFLSAGVEINAIDLSEGGNPELHDTVTSPSLEHYFHRASFDEDDIVQEVCTKLLKVPDSQRSFRSPSITERLAKLEGNISSAIAKNLGQDYTIKAGEAYSAFDKVVEAGSPEYKWNSKAESDDDIPDEAFEKEDKKDICKYLQQECSLYAESGMCNDVPVLKGMKKFCQKTCSFCG